MEVVAMLVGFLLLGVVISVPMLCLCSTDQEKGLWLFVTDDVVAREERDELGTNEGYVVITQQDVVDGVACFVARSISSLPQSKVRRKFQFLCTAQICLFFSIKLGCVIEHFTYHISHITFHISHFTLYGIGMTLTRNLELQNMSPDELQQGTRSSPPLKFTGLMSALL
jgi:hypothetical protein